MLASTKSPRWLLPCFTSLLSLAMAGCFEDPAATTTNASDDDEETSEGDGDGDPSGDGDGDPSGDGDGDPSGDGDGDPSGDGDGDPSGDGDGDPSGDGDGDGDLPAVYSFSQHLCDADISSWTAGAPTNILCNGQGTPNEGWARIHPSLPVENVANFNNALELATFAANDGLIQAIYLDLDFSAMDKPMLRSRVGCSQQVDCEVFWQIIVREVGIQQPILFVEGVQTNDGMFAPVAIDLFPHKNKFLEIAIIMTNNDAFTNGDIVVFEDPRVVDEAP